jgi:fimbrial chaperone protein
MLRVRIVLLAACVMLVAGPPCRAAAINVSPTTVSVDPRALSGSVMVSNAGREPLRIRVSVAAWRNTVTGEIELESTDAVIAFPRFAVVAPGASQRVRVGPVAQHPRSVEGSYRLLIEEMPSGRAEQGIAVRTRLSIPVFLVPSSPMPSVRVGDPVPTDGGLAATIVNTGNVHLRYDSVRLRLVGRSGGVRFTRDVPGWYLLAGESREVHLPAPPVDACRDARELLVDVVVGDKVLTTRADPSACRF